MNLVSKWVMSIVGAAVLGVLADIIMPEGSTKKYIKSIMSIITLFIILSPLPGLLNKKWDYTELFSGKDIQADKRIVDNVNLQQLAVLEDSIENKLSMDGINDVQIKLTAIIDNNVLKVRAVSVNVSRCDIKKDSKTFDKIKEKIKGYLNDEDIAVIVYG